MKTKLIIPALLLSLCTFAQSSLKTTAVTYTVDSIGYSPVSPFNVGTIVLNGVDDLYSQVVSLPFPFHFFDGTYNSIVIGGNGIVSFDTSLANDYCPWPLTVTNPNPTLPRNSIFCPFHDLDPSQGGNIYYRTSGTAPNRIFVVNFSSIPMFSCTTQVATHQVALYEGSNFIDIYIQNSTSCLAWNSGNSLIGIQDSTGTVGYYPTGRNTGAWSTSSEAWRFGYIYTGISENENEFNITLYPNPATESVTLKNLPFFSVIEITDALGQRVLEMNSENSLQQIDLSHFSQGMYLIKIQKNGKVIFREKLVKH